MLETSQLLFVLPTPIKLDVLQQWLSYYPDKSAAMSLEQGFSQGFPLQFQGPQERKNAKCLKSATDRPDVVHKKLKAEIDMGRLAGPFVFPPFPNLQCSPIGLVPKQKPGSFRLIHHLLYPLGGSVNDFIDKEDCKVHYASFDNALDLAMSVGPRAWLAKTDIKSAFRLLPVAPSDYELLDFQFQGKFYYDRCLPMGCSISCAHS